MIIPFHDEENEIKIMLDGLIDWSKLPDEIIVINTSKSNRDEFLQKYELFHGKEHKLDNF